MMRGRTESDRMHFLLQKLHNTRRAQ